MAGIRRSIRPLNAGRYEGSDGLESRLEVKRFSAGDLGIVSGGRVSAVECGASNTQETLSSLKDLPLDDGLVLSFEALLEVDRGRGRALGLVCLFVEGDPTRHFGVTEQIEDISWLPWTSPAKQSQGVESIDHFPSAGMKIGEQQENHTGYHRLIWMDGEAECQRHAALRCGSSEVL